MGLNLLFSSSRGDTYIKHEEVVITPPNPDPTKYKILKYVEIKKYLVIEILYKGCTNFEGRKLLVFECTIKQLKKQKFIDPHFDDSADFISPIARFEPTDKGWKMALALVNNM